MDRGAWQVTVHRGHEQLDTTEQLKHTRTHTHTHIRTTQSDGMGREEGGGFRMGNTCTPVADSC